MNWMLLFSDLTARLIGLVGTLATATTIYLAIQAYSDSHPFGFPYAIIALWSLVKTLDFLWPPRHERVVARTQRTWPRLVFLVTTGVWLVLAFASISATANRLGLNPDGTMAGPSVGAALVITGLFVIFFVLGLGYRAARAQMPEAELQAALTSPKALRRAEERHLQAQGAIRRNDLWDALLGVPLAIPLLLGFISMRDGSTVPTAEHAAWVEANMLLIILAIAAVALVVQIVGVRRAPTTAMHARWSPGFRVLVMMGAGVPLFTGIMWFLGPLHALPYGWHLATTQPVANVTYQVTDIRDGRRSSVCVTLRPDDTPDYEVRSCGFRDSDTAGLRRGDWLEARGELSRFGHTISEFRVIPPENAASAVP